MIRQRLNRSSLFATTWTIHLAQKLSAELTALASESDADKPVQTKYTKNRTRNKPELQFQFSTALVQMLVVLI